MPQTIARLYSDQATADAVIKDLQSNGFSPDAMCTIAQPATGSAVDSITKVGISAAAAKVYAEHLQRGEVLVGVQPAFGYARSAVNILDGHNPVAADVPAEAAAAPAQTSAAAPSGAGWADQAAPFSAALGWAVLSSDPTPFSNWLKRPVLKQDPPTSPTLESIRKSSDPAPFSTKLGLKLLSDHDAPVSPKLGWGSGLLSDKSAPFSEKLGWSVLSDDPTPLSTKLGWRTLTNNPAPLSSWLGLSTVSKS